MKKYFLEPFEGIFGEVVLPAERGEIVDKAGKDRLEVLQGCGHDDKSGVGDPPTPLGRSWDCNVH